MTIADAADAIARENIVAWICCAVVLCTAIICLTIFAVKTGDWPWNFPPSKKDDRGPT